ncbi:MAG: O-antigen ligase family protein [Candidatus Moranbacteria bacterium]|nr:O-antigen ligase family protein [Candidatus Moranbacteria bacterium]
MKKRLKIEHLIYLIIFFLPAYLLRFYIFGIPTNVLEILIIILGVAWLAEIKNENLKSFWQEYKKIIFSFLIIILGLLASTLINKNYATGLGIIKGWFIIPFLFFLIIKTALPDKEKAVKAFYYSALAVSMLGIIYYVAGRLTFDGRLQIFFNSPNYLAMYLAPAVIIGAVRFNKSRTFLQNIKLRRKNLPNPIIFESNHENFWKVRDKKPVFFIISLGIILLTLYLTFSYAAWAALFISLLVIEIVKAKRSFFHSGIFKSTLIIFILFLFLQLGGNKFYDLKTLAERSSFSSRTMIWKSAEKILSDNWLWGIGPGNFQNRYLEYQPYFPPYLEWAVPHPHNLFLNFWLSGGLLALLGFLALLYFWLKRIKKQKSDVFFFIALGIMLAILIQGLVDTTFFKNDLAIIFWLAFL